MLRGGAGSPAGGVDDHGAMWADVSLRVFLPRLWRDRLAANAHLQTKKVRECIIRTRATAQFQ